MTDGHKRHLMATRLAVEDICRQIEQVASEGRSPANNQRLTPLHPDSWKAISTILEHLKGSITNYMARLVPEEEVQREQCEPLSVTLYWLSVLLLHLDEEVIEDIHPAKTVPKFGELSPEERAQLEELVAQMHEDVERIRAYIARIRRTM